MSGERLEHAARKFQALLGVELEALLSQAASVQAGTKKAVVLSGGVYALVGFRSLLRGKALLRTISGITTALVWRFVTGIKRQRSPLNTRYISLLFGTDGPVQKVCMLYCDARGEEFVAKAGATPQADVLVMHEAEYLARLLSISSVSRHLPPLLPRIPGQAIFSAKRVPTAPVSGRWSKSKEEFLAKLQCCGIGSNDDIYEAQLSGLLINFADLEPVCARTFQAYVRARSSLLSRLPRCVAHGDFAPWNMGMHEGCLIVFDWENARSNWNPATDIFHFLLVPSFVRRKSQARIDKLVVAAERVVLSFLKKLHPTCVWNAEDVRVLFYLYCIELVASYSVLSGYMDVEHPVVQSALAQLAPLRNVGLGR